MKSLENTSKVGEYKELENSTEAKDSYISLKDYQIPELVAVETGDIVEQQSRDIAEKNLDKDQENLKKSGIKGFIKNIWKHNIAKEYTRQIEINKARKNLLESQNIYAGEDDSINIEDAQKEAMNALIERFAYQDEEKTTLEHTESGEKRDKIELGDFKDYLIKYIKNEITLEEFQHYKIIFLESDQAYGEKYEDNQLKYFDNILEVADNLKVKFDHEKQLSDLDDVELELTKILEQKFDKIIIARNAKLGVRTEAQYTNSDRVVEWIKKTPVGKLVSPTTLSLAVGIASSAIASSFQGATKGFAIGAGIVGAGALVSGGVSSMKEGNKLSNERRQHNREMAKGGEIENKSKKREELEKYRYETLSANQLSESLEIYLNTKIDEDNRDEIEKLLTEIEAKILVSDTEKIDLISYSRFDKIEQERTRLDINRARLRVKLNKFDKEKAQIIQTDLQEPDYGKKLKLEKEFLLDNQEKKDILFQKMRGRKMAGAFVKGALTSVVAGAVFQEGTALFDKNRDGVIEGLMNRTEASSSITPLEKLREYIVGKIEEGKNVVEKIIPKNISLENTEIKISSDKYDIIDLDKDGIYHIVDNENNVIHPDIDIEFSEDGTISDNVIDRLKKNGIDVSQHTIPIETGETVERLIAIDEFIENNNGINVDYVDYATNNTDFADGNELGLDYGINEDREVILKLNMIENGSVTPSGESINVIDEMSKGNVKVAFYADSDLSKKALVIMKLDRNGDIIVPDTIRNNFFDNEGEFIGGRMQVLVDRNNPNTDLLESVAIAGLEGKGIMEAVVETPNILYKTNLSMEFPIESQFITESVDAVKILEAPVNLPVYDTLKDNSRLETLKSNNPKASSVLSRTSIPQEQAEAVFTRVVGEDIDRNTQSEVSVELENGEQKSEVEKLNNLLNQDLKNESFLTNNNEESILNVSDFMSLGQKLDNNMDNLYIDRDRLSNVYNIDKLVQLGYEYNIIAKYSSETIKNILDLEDMFQKDFFSSLENISKIFDKTLYIKNLLNAESNKYLLMPVGSLEDRINIADKDLRVSVIDAKINNKVYEYVNKIIENDNLESTWKISSENTNEIKMVVYNLIKLHSILKNTVSMSSDKISVTPYNKLLNKIEKKYYEYHMSFLSEAEVCMGLIYNIKERFQSGESISDEDKIKLEEARTKLEDIRARFKVMQAQQDNYSIKEQILTLDENYIMELSQFPIESIIIQEINDINSILNA